MAKRKKVIDTTASGTYYVARITQRLTLFTAIGLTVWQWVTVTVISIGVWLASEQEGVVFRDENALSQQASAIIDKLSYWTLAWCIAAGIISLGLLILPRVRKYEKSLVVDSVVVVAFCITAVVLSQAMHGYLYISI